MKYFSVDESPSYTDHFLIKNNFKNLPLYYTCGSYNILPARILGLSYANYLRMCRDLYGAEITGKNNGYPVAYFKEKENAEKLVKLLDKYTKKILEEVNLTFY